MEKGSEPTSPKGVSNLCSSGICSLRRKKIQGFEKWVLVSVLRERIWSQIEGFGLVSGCRYCLLNGGRLLSGM